MAHSALVRSIASANPTLQSYMPMSPHALMREIAAACVASGISTSRFGRDAIRDPALYHDLRKEGRELRHDTLVRVLMHLNRLAIDRTREVDARADMARLDRENARKAVTLPENHWLPINQMPIGDQRNIVVEVRGAYHGDTALAYFTGSAWAHAPISSDPQLIEFRPREYRFAAALSGEAVSHA